MNAGRHWFQFATRELLEIVFWLSLGIGAIRVAALMDPLGSPREFAVWLIPVLAPGAAFGAALGVLFRRRAAMACAAAACFLRMM